MQGHVEPDKRRDVVELVEKTEILLVDDRPENLLALEAALASPTYRLVKCRSGDETLRYLLDHSPALILMDVQMPELDGFETASIIKRSERTREIPIIFVTALNTEERYIHRGYEFGAVDYITKPFDAHILKSKVAVFAELANKTRRLLQAEKKLRETEHRDRERQIAELELKSLKREQTDQRRYLDLVEGIEHGIVWSAHPDSLALTYISPSVERILGIPPEDCKANARFLMTNLFPENAELLHRSLHGLSQAQSEIRLEHRLTTTDGRQVWLHTGIRKAQRLESGHEIRGLSIDITPIKEAEEKLRRAHLRSDLIARVSLHLSEYSESNSFLEPIGSILVPSFARSMSLETLGEDGSPRVLVATHDSPASEKIWNSIASERMQTLQDGSARILKNSIVLAPLVLRGRATGVLCFSSASFSFDQEDLRLAENLAHRIALAIEASRLQRELKGAIHARDEFLSIASHELNTPLTPLKIQIQTLMRAVKQDQNTLKPEKIGRMIESSERQIKRLQKLIEGLLNISRITAGKVALYPEEFDLIELVRDSIDRFGELIMETGTSVRLQGPAKSKVFLDRLRIEQVVVNLLTNALKYGAGRPLEIRIEDEENGVAIHFEDQGIGIAPEDQHRIFDRFERVISNRQIGGLGLGLYIVKQILESHGGSIRVQSEYGVGSCFTIKLPRSIPPAEPDAQ